jgi:hypothetical protein
LRRVQLVYEPNTGACGEVIFAEGQYKGNTYSGQFYCNKSYFLTNLPPGRSPTLYSPDTNPLIGTWRMTSRFGTSYIWQFEANWTGTDHRGSYIGKVDYRLIGDILAVRSENHNDWTLYQLKAVAEDKVEMTDTRPNGSDSEQYVLTRVRD